MSSWVVVKNSDQPAQALSLRVAESSDSSPEKYAAANPPKGADILVRVSHAALNPADLQFMKIIPTWVPFRRSAIPGLDFAGEIIAAGPNAASVGAHAANPLTVGTLVVGCMSVGLVATGHGSLAQYVTVPAELVSRLPFGLEESAKGGGNASASLSTAVGFLGCAGQTAHLVINDSSAQAALAVESPRVLINGASGSVGSLLIQIAKARGAYVVAVCSAANAEMVKGLGADEAIDYNEHAPLPTYLTATHSKQPFNLICDCVGDQQLFSNSTGYLTYNGAFISIVGGPTQGVVPFVRNKLIPTFMGGTARTFKILGMMPSGDRARGVAKWVEDGTLKQMPIDSEYKFGDVVKAYEKLATKRARGKIIIRVQE